MDKTLGERISEGRKKKGVSQEKLAEELNCTRQMVSRWELNDAKPRTENMMKLSEILDIPLDELVGNEKNSDKIEKINNKKSENPVAKKTINFKKILIILFIVVIVLVGIYGSYSGYKFAVLNIVSSKIKQYENLENYYFKNEHFIDGNIQNSEEVWYKDGIYKIVEASYYNNQKIESVRYLDLNKNIMNFLFEANKTYSEIPLMDINNFENGKYLYNKFPSIIKKEFTNFKDLSKKINLIFLSKSKNERKLKINDETLYFDFNYLPKSDNIVMRENSNIQKNCNTYNIILKNVTDKDIKIPDEYKKIN